MTKGTCEKHELLQIDAKFGEVASGGVRLD